MKTRKGFTLIELLVVISIISILAAILFPTFASAKKKGQQVTCLNNLRQLGMAINLYCMDYDGLYPDENWVPNMELPDPNFRVSDGGLYSYVKNDAVYKCRSDMNAEINRLSYKMNELLMKRPDCAVDDPSDTVLLLDAVVNNSIFTVKTAAGAMPASGTPIPVSDPDVPAESLPNPMNAVHLDRADVLYTDGHVKSVGYGHLTTDQFELD